MSTQDYRTIKRLFEELSEDERERFMAYLLSLKKNKETPDTERPAPDPRAKGN